MRTQTHKTRAGYTLVEMLVAAAVAIGLMVIITGAFSHGLSTFSKLKAQGTLMERMRATSSVVREDLTTIHFLRGTATEYLAEEQPHTVGFTPPPNGYFRIWQGAMPNNAFNNPFEFEGSDPEGINYCRATTHMLSFTARSRGTTPDEMFMVQEPWPANPAVQWPRSWIDPQDYRYPNTFFSRWAEVAYFLVALQDANGNPETANGTQLYALHRRQRLLLPFISGLTQPVAATGNPEISTRTQVSAPVGQFYNLSGSVTQPRNRFGMLPGNNLAIAIPNTEPTPDPRCAGFPIVTDPVDGRLRYQTLAEESAAGVAGAAGREGEDVMLSDVISMEIKALWRFDAAVDNKPPQASYFVPAFGATPLANTDFPFDYLPWSTRNQFFGNPATSPVSVKARVFDTWSNANGSPYDFVPTYVPPGLDPEPAAHPGALPNSVQMWDRVNNVATPAQTAARIPLRITIRAIQLKIRCWDRKTMQTRQITIVQDV